MIRSILALSCLLVLVCSASAEWKRGPLPPNSWNFGAIATAETGSYGFYFADFMGDHALIIPGKKKVNADAILWYDNSIVLPPTMKEKAKADPAAPAETPVTGWKKGPLPAGVRGDGVLVAQSISSYRGYLFANFRGDGVAIVIPDWKTVRGPDVLWYNVIELPPMEKTDLATPAVIEPAVVLGSSTVTTSNVTVHGKFRDSGRVGIRARLRSGPAFQRIALRARSGC